MIFVDYRVMHIQKKDKRTFELVEPSLHCCSWSLSVLFFSTVRNKSNHNALPLPHLPQHTQSTEIAMKECVAYEGVAADYEKGAEGDLYEKPL